MKSLYGQYLEERSGINILETSESFVTYEFSGSECVINDVFVTKEGRGKGEARRLCQEIVDQARARACLRIVATVELGTKCSTESLSFLLSLGLKILAGDSKYLYLIYIL